jgi:hypothetical protein
MPLYLREANSYKKLIPKIDEEACYIADVFIFGCCLFCET